QFRGDFRATGLEFLPCSGGVINPSLLLLPNDVVEMPREYLFLTRKFLQPLLEGPPLRVQRGELGTIADALGEDRLLDLLVDLLEAIYRMHSVLVQRVQ